MISIENDATVRVIWLFELQDRVYRLFLKMEVGL